MNFYREAALALRQNTAPAIMYIAFGAALAGIDTAVDLFVLAPSAQDAPDRFLSLIIIATSIGLVALSSVANTVFFARIGREMDKPNWRVSDDREAMRLFYRLWLLLGLLTLVYIRLFEQLLPDAPDAGTLLIFLCSFFVWATLLNVFGAFVMFYGRAGKEEITQALRTMGHHLGPILAVSLLGLLAGLVLYDAHFRAVVVGRDASAMTTTDYAARFLIDILIGAADSLVSCFIFAYAWLVCIFHRDHFEEPGDDFDF